MSNYCKKNIRVGIVLPRTKDGGHFQLALSIADSLIKYSREFHYVILYHDKEMLQWLTNLDEKTPVVPVEARTVWQQAAAFVNILLRCKLLPMKSKKQSANLEKAHIDLLITPFHALFGFMSEIPYVITITSMNHKYHLKSLGSETLRNRFVPDIVYRSAARHSVLNVVDSLQGMDDLNGFYGIARDKMRIIPHMPSGYIYDNSSMDLASANEILGKFILPERYIFFPSQFFHGKNHKRLILSLRLIEQLHGTRIPAVFAGRTGESHAEVIDLVKQTQMEDQIVDLGFASDKEIVALYKNAEALVYPCLFGPTNLPPLEGMILGTPVLCSNVFSMPEQVGDAALLFDPFSIEDMAEKIYTLWSDESLRKDLRQKGYERVKDLTQENYAKQWEDVIETALRKKGVAV